METKLIEETVRTLIEKIGLPIDGIEVTTVAGSTVITVRTVESGKLIGKNGETLSAINQLVKKMLESQIPRDAHFVVDVNGYHQKKIKALEDQAKLVAERARTFRYDVELPPMNAYERMVIHSTLKEVQDIQTISHGEGPLRHIVVRYIDPTQPRSEGSVV